MNRFIVGKSAALLGALLVASGISVVGAAPASANPDLCVSGPFGYAYACVQGPGWVDWHGPWYGGPRPFRGWGHGDGNDQGEND